ncbi:MAG: tRNA lysidine(34) synthetase TilS, partial [Deltaproteobacteria bacterium]
MNDTGKNRLEKENRPMKRPVAETEAFREKIRQAIIEYRMFQPGDKVLVGVSGGPDSVALLHLLVEMAAGYDFVLGICHLNHDLRGAAADRDADFVAALARRIGLPLHTDKRDVRRFGRCHRLSLETAARRVRYGFFKEIVARHGFTKIALGHQMDDNAEQVLMNLLRGSGPTGLSGIPPVRDGLIVRPLIHVTRQQIMDYLDRGKHDYVIDESNTDGRHLRNRIRSELIPLLAAEYNPRIVCNLHKTARVCRSENQWIDQALDPVFDAAVVDRSTSQLAMSLSKISAHMPAVQRRLVRRAIRQVAGDLKKVSFENIEAVRRLAAAGTSWKTIDLPHRVRVQRMDRVLVFTREKRSLRDIPPARPEKTIAPFSYYYSPPGEIAIVEAGIRMVSTILERGQIPEQFHAGDPASETTAYLDLDKLTFPLMIRNRKAGDRFSPLGLGGTQSVRKFLSGREKDRRKRALCPVMISAGRIVWTIGHGIADEVKIDPATRRGVKV